MKIGAIVICRYNSSRLPGKILKEINGKPLIAYILERLATVDGLDEVVIATSIEDTDQPIVDYCEQNQIKYFRGDLDNVALRFLDCANQFNLDYAIRVNGDNLFLDARVMQEMIAITRNNNFDMISNVEGRSFPKGVSVEIVNVLFYNAMYPKFDTSYYREHVTIYFYENKDSGNFHYYLNTTLPEAAGVQLAIDTEEDYEIATGILNSFDKDHTQYGFEDVYKSLLQLKPLS